MYVYIYIYIHPLSRLVSRRLIAPALLNESHDKGCPFLGAEDATVGIRKGSNGVSTNGVTANVIMFFGRGTFWVLPLTYFYLPKSAGAYLFPQSVNIHYFCSGTVSVDPICPQPNPFASAAAIHTYIYIYMYYYYYYYAYYYY